MRGDRPYLSYVSSIALPFTPHARGSTRHDEHAMDHMRVYPACAGIDRFQFGLKFFDLRLPRMRGDRPRSSSLAVSSKRFTPHARGSTLSHVTFVCRPGVYPACAGIDPPC